MNYYIGIDLGGMSTKVEIASLGIIDSKNGIVVRWANLGWENVLLAGLIQSRIGRPVLLPTMQMRRILAKQHIAAEKNIPTVPCSPLVRTSAAES